MRKKTQITRFPNAKSGSPVESWHNGGDTKICSYARSLQNAAKTLLENLNGDQNARTDWDVCPVVLLYRHVLELRLKLLVGEGSNFLPSPTDPISLSTSHSLRWLAQIVCRIVKTVGWENEFRCDGVASLADFTALVNEVESFDPVARAIRSSRSATTTPEYFRNFDIFQFSKRLDALLELLDATADALTATADQREVMAEDSELEVRKDFKLTIH